MCLLWESLTEDTTSISCISTSTHKLNRSLVVQSKAQSPYVKNYSQILMIAHIKTLKLLKQLENYQNGHSIIKMFLLTKNYQKSLLKNGNL